MALMRCDFFSEVLAVGTSMTVLLPEASVGREFRVLYLLHGLSDDDTAWVRNTSIERYAEDLAVVMPRVERSFYADEANGRPYWTFLTEELPQVAGGLFRLSDRREDTFVAGLSMGGYGALKWAMRRPDRFAAAASLSGVLDLADRQRTPAGGNDPRLWRRVFDDTSVTGGDDDLFHLLDTVADPPALYISCGEDDPLYPGNVRFAQACRDRDIPLQTRFGPGGHDWSYWDTHIRGVLDWLPVS
jgi:S-formylglutathione hydrolase FrmB